MIHLSAVVVVAVETSRSDTLSAEAGEQNSFTDAPKDCRRVCSRASMIRP